MRGEFLNRYQHGSGKNRWEQAVSVPCRRGSKICSFAAEQRCRKEAREERAAQEPTCESRKVTPGK